MIAVLTLFLRPVFRPALPALRARLERELGESHPLKAAAGGYYDIDFALMYLRLRSAGIFFKVLNTPERIDIIEKMGHLDRADAVFLLDAVDAKHATTEFACREMPFRIFLKYRSELLLYRPSTPAHSVVLAPG